MAAAFRRKLVVITLCGEHNFDGSGWQEKNRSGNLGCSTLVMSPQVGNKQTQFAWTFALVDRHLSCQPVCWTHLQWLRLTIEKTKEWNLNILCGWNLRVKFYSASPYCSIGSSIVWQPLESCLKKALFSKLRCIMLRTSVTNLRCLMNCELLQNIHFVLRLACPLSMVMFHGPRGRLSRIGKGCYPSALVWTTMNFGNM